MLLVCARRVGRNIRCCLARLDEFIIDQVPFDFFAADVGEHLPIDLDTGRKRLSTLGLHFPAERRILDNVLFFVWKIVFGQHGAHTGAPATIGFQICDDFWRLHCAIYREAELGKALNGRDVEAVDMITAWSSLSSFLSSRRTKAVSLPINFLQKVMCNPAAERSKANRDGNSE